MFKILLPVTIADINYGGHLGHDRLLSLMHEARLAFFEQFSQSEIDFFGVGLILKALQVSYRQEAFRGDVLEMSIHIEQIRGSGFEMHYVIRNQDAALIAEAVVEMVAFDYGQRRVVRLPDSGRQLLTQLPPLSAATDSGENIHLMTVYLS